MKFNLPILWSSIKEVGIPYISILAGFFLLFLIYQCMLAYVPMILGVGLMVLLPMFAMIGFVYFENLKKEKK